MFLRRPLFVTTLGIFAAGFTLSLSLPIQAACTNPSTIPVGFAAPCPVFSLSSASVTQAQTLILSAAPQPGTDYIYTQAYISNGTAWNPYTLSGNNAYPSYSSALASLTLSSTQLQTLSLGTHYAVVWDWLWDATAGCYKGPGLNQCNTGAWRVQSFSVTSAATPTPTPYTYSQSSYYAYSQSAYYAYSQSAYVTPTPTPSASPASIWPSSTVPGTPSANDTQAVELGLKFKSDVSGSITGIRFYKGSTNTGTHIGNLWTTAGIKLASVTFTGETASGWQQANFASSVSISANTTYIASYFAPVGHYALDSSYFATSGVDTPPLHALANTTSPNGVYIYSAASAFPTQTYSASNYWVDVVFAASSSYTYSQSSYYAYSQSTYYVYSQSSYYAYSQSSYYAYSQSSYYAYSQSAYTSGTTYYVSPTGNDANTGKSTSAAFATIQKCASVVVAGDTCDVVSGTYNVSSQISTGHSGTSANPITYKSATKWGAHIVAQSGISTNVWYNTGSYVTIDGFDITVVPTNTVGVIIKTDGSYNRFTNNRLHDDIWTTCGSGAAIETTYNINLTPHNTQNEYIANNIVYNIGADISVTCDQLHGFYIGSDYSTIVNNLIIHAQSGLALQIYGDTPVHNVISSNTVVNSNYGIGIGSNVSPAADYNYISNNIAYNNYVYGIYEVGGIQGSHEVFTNNLSYGNLQGNFVVGTPSLNPVIANPLFVNYTGTGTGDYHLQSTSPAINAGTATSAPAIDLDGVTRPQGSGYDIGAYEWH